MMMEDERKEIIDSLPKLPNIDRYPTDQPNAWVYVDHSGRLSILLKDGGWLGIDQRDFDHIEADIAPFSD